MAAATDGSVKGEHAMHAKARAVMFFRRACELGDAKVSAAARERGSEGARERGSEGTGGRECAGV